MEEVGETILAVQRENKQRFAEEGFRLDVSEPWIDLSNQPASVTAGWTGARIEAWRAEASLVWWHALVTLPRRAQRSPKGSVDTSYADWSGAWLDLDAVARDREGFNKMWYHDVKVEAMPRRWLRSVLPWVQLQTKLGSGNPRDAQHAAYLPDADLFVTADRRLHQGLELVRPWARWPFAHTALVPGKGSILEPLEATLAAGRSSL